MASLLFGFKMDRKSLKEFVVMINCLESGLFTMQMEAWGGKKSILIDQSRQVFCFNNDKYLHNPDGDNYLIIFNGLNLNL